MTSTIKMGSDALYVITYSFIVNIHSLYCLVEFTVMCLHMCITYTVDTLCCRLLSLSVIHQGFIHVAVYMNSLFLFVTERCVIVGMLCTLLILCPGEGCLDCFPFVAILNKVAINACK